MDTRETTSVRKTKDASMQRTHTPHAKPPATFRAGSRRIQLRHRGNPKSTRRTKEVAPSSLLLRNPIRSRAKLRRLRQRTPSHSQITQALESLPGRSTSSNRHSHRSRQSALLEGAEENKLKGSKGISRAIGVQLRAKAYSGNKKRKGGRAITKKRLQHRKRRQRRGDRPPRRKIHQNHRRRTNGES